MGKFNVGVVVLNLSKTIPLFCAMCPNKEKNVDISKPYQRLKLLPIKEINFYFVPKIENMYRSKFGTNCSP